MQLLFPVLTSSSLDSVSPILFGVLLTLLVLCFAIFVRVYYIKATTTATTITNVSADLVKQHGSKQDASTKVRGHLLRGEGLINTELLLY